MPDFDPALVERINAAIRSVDIRLGPNALAILTAGGTVPLSQGESWFMAIAVADELFGDGQDNAAVVQRLLDAKDTEIQRLREQLAAAVPEQRPTAQCHRLREHPGHLWFRNREPVRCPGFPLNPAPRESSSCP